MEYPSIDVKDLGLEIRGKTILKSINLRIQGYEKVAIVGPNGSGKTSLIKCLAGYTRPTTGQVLLNQQLLEKIPALERRQILAWVPQDVPPDIDFTTSRFLRLGGLASEALLGKLKARFRLEGIWEQKFSTLSGGERQRVLMAHCLTQSPQCLLLDEVTNHLDIRHQLELMEAIRDEPVMAVMVLHDLNHALRFFDRVVVLHQGRVLADGPPAESLEQGLIFKAFGVDSELVGGRLLDFRGWGSKG